MSMNTTRDKIPNLRVGEGQGQTADDCSPATETWPSAIVVLVCEAMYMVCATVLGKHPLQRSMVQRPGHDRREWLSLRGIGEINDCYSISRTPCCRPPSCSKIDCILCTKWNHSRSQVSPSPGSHTVLKVVHLCYTLLFLPPHVGEFMHATRSNCRLMDALERKSWTQDDTSLP